MPGKRRSWLPRSFSLRSLFVITLLAIIASIWFQRHTDRARFEVLESDLRIENGYLSGSMSFRCSRLNERGRIETADTVLRVEHLADTRMMDLKEGDEFFVRYRHYDFGPIKRENRYVIFMVSELGIHKEEIVGFVQLDGWAEVHIRGEAKALP